MIHTIVKISYRLAASAAKNTSFSTLTQTNNLTQLYSHRLQAFKLQIQNWLQLSTSSFELRDDEHLLKEWWGKKIFHRIHETEQQPNKKEKQTKSQTSAKYKFVQENWYWNCALWLTADAAIRFENDKATQSVLVSKRSKRRIIRKI